MKLIKQVVPFKLKRKIKDKLGVPSLHWSLLNLKACGFDPSFTIDIGAYKGEWTEQFLEVFPGKKVLMVEPQQSKKIFLEKVAAKHPTVNYVCTLLSSSHGAIVSFFENETASHVVTSNEHHSAGNKSYTTQTLDNLVTANGEPLPNFIKLDVQGHELEVLKGAERCLNNCELCLLEVTFLDLVSGDPLITDVLNFMDNNGFKAYDISQLMRRPFDKALYQADIFFVKKNSNLISNKSW